jgi:uncharacterized LabA/DUF88 family protein
MKKRTFLFIDGSNFYAAQYALFGPKKYLHFPSFLTSLKKKFLIVFDRVYFYASYSPIPKKPTEKEKFYLKNEAFFYQNVKKVKNLTFFKGYRSKTSGKEKEIDVKLAVDIVHFAHHNEYDSLYFYSADADFTHALYVAQELNKKVFILALENRIPMRFVYIFPTYVLSFGKFKKYQIQKKQKIYVISLSQGCIKTT